ncbi:FadR/GntR family transcriptional regulator [Modicisalibacter luteus]|uniref:FadR/GntR family transcriptional regulator n=1 Tax=Modicisalibacter luteus TaxID=453962 RepID=UPI0003A68612
MFVVSTRPNRGFSLRDHDAQSIEHVLRMVELRMGFEVEAAALAAERRTRHDLTMMLDAQESFREAVASGDIQAGVDADMAFHRAVCTAADNELYLEFFNYLSSYLKETILVSRRKAATRVDGGQAPIAEHQTLIDAITNQDVDAARSAARYHIECNKHRLQTYYDVKD